MHTSASARVSKVKRATSVRKLVEAHLARILLGL
jgi:hypothetical protein